MSDDDGTSEPVPFNFVSITSPFWRERQRTIHGSTLIHIYEKMKETGRWDAMKLGWKPGDPNRPHHFWDSDIAKWIEAACYSLTLLPDANLSRLVEEAVDMIRKAQHEDGYINTYYTVVEPGKRFTNLAWMHELYCAGHLLEASLAHYSYSGSRRLLGPMLRYMHLINDTFGIEEGKKKGYPGHEEIELALIKAFEVTQEVWLFDLARYFIEQRGRQRPEGHYFDVEARERGEPPRPGPGHGPPYSYHQADQPIRGIQSVEGHAVRAMYWLTAATGVARLMEDKALMAHVEGLWESTTERKMYVTGGLGAIPEWEGFGPDYYLPNETGYLETCASVGLVLFAHQLARTQPRKMVYSDAMELALHNGVLVGLALDGTKFFYENPLAVDDMYLERKEWFAVACCPANAARLLSSVGGYIYSMGVDDTVFVHLYISSRTNVTLTSGERVSIVQDSRGPWDGGATFRIAALGKESGGKAVSWTKVALCFRIPPGCEDTFRVTAEDGSASIATKESSKRHRLVVIRPKIPLGAAAPTARTTIKVFFKFTPQRIHPHPLVLANRHSVAITRGPFVYCVESVDNPHIGDLRAIRIPEDAEFVPVVDDGKVFAGWEREWRPVVLRTKVSLVEDEDGDDDGGGDGEHGPGGERRARGGELVPLTLIPYFMWANRGRSNMRVWLPRE